MMSPADFQPGLYRHYKGNYYLAIGIVSDSTNKSNGRPMVLYWSLDHGPNDAHVRELEEFIGDTETGEKRFVPVKSS